MSIKQMQVSYNYDQDRVHLVINTNKSESLKFALTRRICRDLFDSIKNIFVPNKMIESTFLDNGDNEGEETGKNQTVLTNYPLGKESILVIKYEINSHDEKLIKITFSCLDGKKVELNIDINAFSDVLILLGKVLDDANWDLGSLISEHGFSYVRPENIRLLN